MISRSELKTALKATRQAGATYADARLRIEEQHALVMRAGSLTRPLYQQPAALIIRANVDGYWGYASTTDLDNTSIRSAAEAAVKIAQSGYLISRQYSLLPHEPQEISAPPKPSYITDPFSIPISERAQLLLELHRLLSVDKRICRTFARLDAVHRFEAYASSEGSSLETDEAITGLHFHAVACDSDLEQRRNSPYHFARRGWEFIESLDLADEANAIARQAVELLDAPPCPTETTNLLLAPSTLALLVYETLGAALELDRVLDGGSYLIPEDKGERIIAAKSVSLKADPTASHAGLGTFDYDDEAVPADDSDLIVDGRVVRFVADRSHALFVEGNQPAGALRSSGLHEQALLRCPALELLPGTQTLESLSETISQGFLIEGALEWEVDPRRERIKLRAERAQSILDGKLSTVHRDPVLELSTQQFWLRVDALTARQVPITIPWTLKGSPAQSAGVTVTTPWATVRGVPLTSV